MTLAMTEPNPSPTLLTVADVAARLRVSTRQVWRLIHDDELETIRLGARSVRVPLESLAAYVARQAERGERERW